MRGGFDGFPCYPCLMTNGRRIGVVLDTNQWISTLLLRTPTAVALLHLLKRAAGVLLVPEVVERELRAKIVERGVTAADQVARGLSDIQRLLGSVQEWLAPSGDAFERGVDERFADLDSLIQRVPLRPEHTSIALDRVVRGMRPTVGNREEFRDHLVWQAILEVAGTGTEIIFVTGDGGFYEGNARNELARDLLPDVSALSVHLVTSLDSCLDRVAHVTPQIDRGILVESLAAVARESLKAVADEEEVQVGVLEKCELKLYATERHDLVSVVFSIVFHIEDGLTLPLFDAIAFMEGTALFDPLTGELPDVRRDRYGIRWINETGEEVGSKYVALRGLTSVNLGPRVVRWTASRELPE